MPPFQRGQEGLQQAAPRNYQFTYGNGTTITGLSWSQYQQLVRERRYYERQRNISDPNAMPPRMTRQEGRREKELYNLSRSVPRRPNETGLAYRQRLEERLLLRLARMRL